MGSSRFGLTPPPGRLLSSVSARVSQALAITRRASLCPGSLILALISMQSWARRRCLKTSSGSFIPRISPRPLSRQLAERRSGSARGRSIFIPSEPIYWGGTPMGRSASGFSIAPDRSSFAASIRYLSAMSRRVSRTLSVTAASA